MLNFLPRTSSLNTRHTMQFKYILFTYSGVIFALVITVVASDQGNQVVNCANCFAQKWEWSSWQCDVNCNVEASPYGNVDAFSAGVQTDGDDQRDFTGGEIILFEKVLLNIQNSYSPDTGMFVTKIAGLYAIYTTTYSWTNVQSRVAIYVEPADGSPAVHLCEAHAPSSYDSATCSVRYELNRGDQVYVRAAPDARVLAPTNGKLFNFFNAEILYKKL